MVGNSVSTSTSGGVPFALPKILTEGAMDDLHSLLQGKVDYQDVRSSIDFPEEKVHYVAVPMSTAYFKKFDALTRGEQLFGLIFNQPSRFFHAYRKTVNKVGAEYISQKVEKAIPILKKGKSVLYSNWIEFGINVIRKSLRNADLSFAVYSGSTPQSQRDRMVKEFNNDKVDVLVITKAGGEGLDLKGVRNVIVLDPPWNDASLRQIVGRANRYRSHHHLPLSQRVVNVYLMVLTEPGVTNWELTEEASSKSGDRLLYRIIKRKRRQAAIIHDALRRWSI